MAEPIYIPYGLEEIDSNALNEALANEYQNYLNSRVWTKGKKGLARAQLWMDAYNEIMNRGITGASVENGLWRINHNGENFLYTDDPRKLEIYEDVASFINDLMKKLPTRKSLEEKKEDKKKTKYDFISNFQLDFLNRYYGNNSNLYKSEWFELDPRGEKGIRGTEKRRNRLIEALTKYRDESLKDEYDYEGTPFSGYDDVKSRITEAIDALQSKNINDDLPALNKLGINYRVLMNNGANDVYETDSNGNPVTYLQYYDNLLKIADAKANEKARLEAAQRANQYTNFRFYDGSRLAGTPPTDKDALERLNSYASLSKLDGKQQSELVGAFKFAEKNGILLNLSKEELLKFGTRWNSNPSRLKKIDGLNGLYWDSIGRRIVQPYNQSNIPQTGFLNLVNLNSPENKQALAKSQLVKQMNLPIQGSLNLSDLSNFGFDEATGNELWAVINDIGAFVNPEAISGTALALNAARLRDKNREGWSWERVLDWGTSALGGLPIIGDAASVVKAGSNLVKLANRSARVGSFIGAAFSAVNMPEAWDSIKKIYDKGITSMTPQDILNITYGLMGLFAGIKTINAVNARQKPQTATEHSIEIDGKKVKLPDQATADKVSTEYKAAKNNTEASLKVVKMQEVRESAKKAGIEVTDASKVTSGSGFLRGNLVSRKLGIGKSPVKSELVNTGEMTGGSTNGYYMPSWRKSFLNLEQKEIKNPLRKTFDWFLGKTPEVKSADTPKTNYTETPKTTETSKPKSIEISKQSKERIKKYNEFVDKRIKDLNEGKFSKNKLKSGDLDISGHKLQVVEQSDGTFNLIYKGNILGNFQKHELKKLQEAIREIINNRTIRIDPNTRVKTIGTKEIGKILLELKRKGWLKQGGTINKLDTIIKDFFKKNNI